jgi:hypothetical protein
MHTPFRAIVLATALAAALPAVAHHSFAAEYDANRPITLAGTVTRLELINPHAWLYIEVRDAQGNASQWNIEMGAPNALIRRGVNKNSVPVGAKVTVDGYRAKDGTNTVNGTTIKLADGRSLFSGSSNSGAPGAPPTAQ